MEAGDGATRLTRRAASEARSRGKATTFENPTTSNPFTALAGQAGQADDSDGGNETDLTEGNVAFPEVPGPPKPKRSIAPRTPKRKTDTIVVVCEEEDPSGCPPRRTRKPSAKGKQNEADQDVFGRRRLGGRVGVDEQAVPENIQDQMDEQTGILRTLLKEWMKQDAHNKKMEAKLAHMEKELETVKGECQAVKAELYKTKQQMADGIAAIMSDRMQTLHARHRRVSRVIYKRSPPCTAQPRK